VKQSDQSNGGNDGETVMVLSSNQSLRFLPPARIAWKPSQGQQRDAESVDAASGRKRSPALDLRPCDPGGEEAERNVG